MIKLYDFQDEAVDELRYRIGKRDKKRIILCSPTGSGKTITACMMALLAVNKGKRVCILVDRIEILSQFYDALKLFNLQPSLITAGCRNIMRSNLYLGMVESFYNRMDKSESIDGLDMCIFDEAHTTAYFKIVKKLNVKSVVIGLTATPVLTGATKERLNEYYDDIVELAKVEELIKRGFLVDCKTWSVDLTEARKLRRNRGEFSEQSQLNAMDTMEVFAGVIANYKRVCDGAPFICYNINVEHSKKMNAFFNFAGIRTRHVDGTTEAAYRKETFEMLKRGEIDGIHNFGICTTGYDEPAIKCIIQNFATDSLSKHVQTNGRGARIAPDKHNFDILDMGMNYSRHGLWNKNKDWTDIFNNPEQASERDRKEVEAIHNLSCTTCGYIANESMEACPICGAIIAEMLAAKINTAKRDKKMTAAELQLIRDQAKNNLPPHLAGKKTSQMTKSQLKQYGEIMGYSAKWYHVKARFARVG